MRHLDSWRKRCVSLRHRERVANRVQNILAWSFSYISGFSSFPSTRSRVSLWRWSFHTSFVSDGHLFGAVFPEKYSILNTSGDDFRSRFRILGSTTDTRAHASAHEFWGKSHVFPTRRWTSDPEVDAALSRSSTCFIVSRADLLFRCVCERCYCCIIFSGAVITCETVSLCHAWLYWCSG